jgi:hypothetical protein
MEVTTLEQGNDVRALKRIQIQLQQAEHLLISNSETTWLYFWH